MEHGIIRTKKGQFKESSLIVGMQMHVPEKKGIKILSLWRKLMQSIWEQIKRIF